MQTNATPTTSLLDAIARAGFVAPIGVRSLAQEVGVEGAPSLRDLLDRMDKALGIAFVKASGQQIVELVNFNDTVVLSITAHDVASQTAQGQYISFSEKGGVRMRPWAIRYATVEQIDSMAEASGFHLEQRWEDAERTQFNADSPRHLSVYRTIHTPVREVRS